MTPTPTGVAIKPPLTPLQKRIAEIDESMARTAGHLKGETDPTARALYLHEVDMLLDKRYRLLEGLDKP